LFISSAEIVFGLYNKQKFHFDNVTTCKSVEIPAGALLNILFSYKPVKIEKNPSGPVVW